MKRALVALVLGTGCLHGTSLVQRKHDSNPDAVADSLYWTAVRNLDATNKNGTLDAGIANLDAYLASPVKLKHATEATVLRSLARNAQQLARIEATLQQRVAAADSKQKAEPDGKARDEEMVKEIQRLKDELAKANEELERIKKRLAAPKP
jgi:chromosome segregation ATPase